MPRTTSRRLLAVLIALVVVCSIGGSPVAAMATDDTGLTDDGVTTGVESPDRTDDGDGDTDDEETDDTDDGETDDSETDDTDDGETDDTDDGETDDGESEGTDGDDTNDEETDGSDDESSAEDDSGDSDTDDGRTGDAGTDGEQRTRSDATWNDSRVVAGGENLTDHEMEDTESLLEANEAGGEDVFGPVDGLEGDTDGVADLYDEELDTTVETEDTRTLKISIGVIELELLTYDDPAYGARAAATGDAGFDSEPTPPQLRATAGSADAGDVERVVAVDAGDDPSEGGEPLPPTPGGGAAVALGTLAAVAAVRSSPFVATEGAKAASSTGTSLLSSLLEKVRPFVLPLRYSRYDDSDPLEHEARERVYAIVNEEPGSYLSEVSEEADLPLSTTRHHIKVLEREELVSGAKLRGKRRFYPAYAEGIELAAALNDDSTATIIDAISRFGAASVSDLADELERDPSTISHHLQRLEDDDIVTRERDGRAVVTRLSSEARTALEPGSTPRPGETAEVLAGGAD